MLRTPVPPRAGGRRCDVRSRGGGVTRRRCKRRARCGIRVRQAGARRGGADRHSSSRLARERESVPMHGTKRDDGYVTRRASGRSRFRRAGGCGAGIPVRVREGSSLFFCASPMRERAASAPRSKCTHVSCADRHAASSGRRDALPFRDRKRTRCVSFPNSKDVADAALRRARSGLLVVETRYVGCRAHDASSRRSVLSRRIRTDDAPTSSPKRRRCPPLPSETARPSR